MLGNASRLSTVDRGKEGTRFEIGVRESVKEEGYVGALNNPECGVIDCPLALVTCLSIRLCFTQRSNTR